MERYLSRNASVGFVALAIACFCLIEIFRGIPWDLIEPLFGDKSDIYLAIVAAIVTIVGLPALGSIFDYLSNPFAQLLRQRRDSFSNMKTIGEQAKVKCGLDQNFDPISAFHLVLYEKCDSKVQVWLHRRRNRTYTASANMLAVVSGIILSIILTGKFPLFVFLTCFLIIIPFMLRVFYYEQKLHDTLVDSWWRMYLESKTC